MLRGVGMSTTVDPSAGPSPETSEMRFDPGGDVTVLVGSTAGGQSHETIYTQIVSDRLGIDAEKIRVVEGDTDKLSWGTGTGAARTATIGGTAVYKAVDKMIEKGERIAAHLLEAAPRPTSSSRTAPTRRRHRPRDRASPTWPRPRSCPTAADGHRDRAVRDRDLVAERAQHPELLPRLRGRDRSRNRHRARSCATPRSRTSASNSTRCWCAARCTAASPRPPARP